ncbi:hypothetical protein ACEE21_15370 [Clostridium baratii]
MGRIFSELVGNEIVVTKYESNGFVIPDKLSQEKIEVVSKIIDDSLDKEDTLSSINDFELGVSRREFIFKLLSMSNECVDKYSVYGKGLYSFEDMDKGITLAEVAYLVYYVGGVKRTLKWGSIEPSEKFKICVLQELVNGKKLINERLAMYKNRVDMEYYIKSIRDGKRYIPLPLYCSFVDLINNPDVDIKLDESMLFKRLSKAELNSLLGG